MRLSVEDLTGIKSDFWLRDHELLRPTPVQMKMTHVIKCAAHDAQTVF